MGYSSLEEFLATGVFIFMLVFVRIGTAMMLLPTFGDATTPTQIKVMVALGLSLVMFPALKAYMPATVPPTPQFLMLLVSEFMIGFFIGTVGRTLMSALDTAGMIVSMQSSLANAQIFNPMFASQGSIFGTFFGVAGVILLFATQLHHLLIAGITESYYYFPVGEMPLTSDMMQMLVRVIGGSFVVAIQMTAPFLIVIMMLYVGMGVLARLMPQLQIFMIIMPAQILLSFFILLGTTGALLTWWLTYFEDAMTFFLKTLER
ncbi:MAG: flagellar biosynthetic protein FliR [Alphaproteobacteria bacterium]|nr:flagellar biosynthetic protein FliR [Alphaproteobacteria bacterium]